MVVARGEGEFHGAGPDVVVLGAGFSKAIYKSLPTTDELGERVRGCLPMADRDRLPSAPFVDGRFEEWVSYLAEPQPHLRVDENLEAQALLHRVMNAMRQVLSIAQLVALSAASPDWIFQLLAVLHLRRAVVITLNYDNLLECGLSGRWLTVPAQVASCVEEEDVLDGLPPLARALEPPPSAMFGNEWVEPVRLHQHLPVDTFRLLMLHGSLSWYWVPGDASGATLQRWQLPGGFGVPIEDD